MKKFLSFVIVMSILSVLIVDCFSMFPIAMDLQQTQVSVTNRIAFNSATSGAVLAGDRMSADFEDSNNVRTLYFEDAGEEVSNFRYVYIDVSGKMDIKVYYQYNNLAMTISPYALQKTYDVYNIDNDIVRLDRAVLYSDFTSTEINGRKDSARISKIEVSNTQGAEINAVWGSNEENSASPSYVQTQQIPLEVRGGQDSAVVTASNDGNSLEISGAAGKQITFGIKGGGALDASAYKYLAVEVVSYSTTTGATGWIAPNWLRVNSAGKQSEISSAFRAYNAARPAVNNGDNVIDLNMISGGVGISDLTFTIDFGAMAAGDKVTIKNVWLTNDKEVAYRTQRLSFNPSSYIFAANTAKSQNGGKSLSWERTTAVTTDTHLQFDQRPVDIANYKYLYFDMGGTSTVGNHITSRFEGPIRAVSNQPFVGFHRIDLSKKFDVNATDLYYIYLDVARGLKGKIYGAFLSNDPNLTVDYTQYGERGGEVKDLILDRSTDPFAVKGQEFDKNQLDITANLIGGASRKLSSSEIAISGYDKTKTGLQTITITETASGAKQTLQVYVLENADSPRIRPLLLKGGYGINSTFTVSYEDANGNPMNGSGYKVITDANRGGFMLDPAEGAVDATFYRYLYVELKSTGGNAVPHHLRLKSGAAELNEADRIQNPLYNGLLVKDLWTVNNGVPVTDLRFLLVCDGMGETNRPTTSVTMWLSNDPLFTNERRIKSISLTSNPKKVDYKVGESIDPDGMRIDAVAVAQDNEGKWTIESPRPYITGAVSIDPYYSRNEGEQQVTVRLMGKMGDKYITSDGKDRTTNFMVRYHQGTPVRPADPNPEITKKLYLKSSSPGVTVRYDGSIEFKNSTGDAVFTDESGEPIDVREYPYLYVNVKEHKVTINPDTGAETTIGSLFDLKINGKTSNNADKGYFVKKFTNYTRLNCRDITVANGTKITNHLITRIAIANAGNSVIEGFYLSKDPYLMLNGRAISGIEIAQYPTKIDYQLNSGESLDLRNSGINLLTNDGGKFDITNDNDIVYSDLDTRTEGRKNIDISFRSFKTSFPVYVVKDLTARLPDYGDRKRIYFEPKRFSTEGRGYVRYNGETKIENGGGGNFVYVSTGFGQKTLGNTSKPNDVFGQAIDEGYVDLAGWKYMYFDISGAIHHLRLNDREGWDNRMGNNADMQYGSALSGWRRMDISQACNTAADTSGNTVGKLTRINYVSVDSATIRGVYLSNDPDLAPPASKGDVNNDGKINIFDIMEIRDHIFGKNTLSGDKFLAADIDGNSNVNIFDIMSIRDYIFGKSGLM